MTEAFLCALLLSAAPLLALGRGLERADSPETTAAPGSRALEDVSEVEDKLHTLDQKMQNRLGQQVAYLRERIEQVESEVHRMNDALTLDWVAAKDGTNFKVFDRSLGWKRAEEFCTTYGGKLASISDESKNNVVTDMMNRLSLGFDEAWIGLRTKAQMISEDSKYSNFNADNQLEGCAVIDRRGKWRIKDCAAEKAFICERSRDQLRRLLY